MGRRRIARKHKGSPSDMPCSAETLLELGLHDLTGLLFYRADGLNFPTKRVPFGTYASCRNKGVVQVIDQEGRLFFGSFMYSLPGKTMDVIREGRSRTSRHVVSRYEVAHVFMDGQLVNFLVALGKKNLKDFFVLDGKLTRRKSLALPNNSVSSPTALSQSST